MHRAERGLFDLMQGRLLHVAGAEGAESAIVVASVEGLVDETLARLRAFSDEPIRLSITARRAEALGLGPGRRNGTTPNGARRPARSVTLGREVDATATFRLATAHAGPGPEGAPVGPATVLESAALDLARVGRLLPAVVSTEVNGAAATASVRAGDLLSVTISDIETITGSPGLEVVRVAEAPVPLAGAENARFVLFREAGGLFEHVAVLIGERENWPDPLPARLHSACFTGDLFGSLRCDCGEQLEGSIRAFTARGGGALLYLSQEGRGIGLANKLRAYALQEEGLDTVDADGMLGFDADERIYDVAVQMLRELDIRRIHLLTNNPEKVRALEAGGIDVVAREPIHGTLNRHNLPYVRAKVHRSGHLLEDMLSGRIED